MPTTRWKPFPYPEKAYDYAGTRLNEHWSRLHHGDREPFPALGDLKKLVEARPEFAPVRIARAGDRQASGRVARLPLRRFRPSRRTRSRRRTARLQRRQQGDQHLRHLSRDQRKRQACAVPRVRRAGRVRLRPRQVRSSTPGISTRQALGRYSQGISVVKALAQGLGGKVRASLEQAIRLEPRHADAHIALGSFHAEIINKVGALLGGLTYGASQDEAVKHFETALKLNPHSAIARIEYANGLAMMFGKAELARATSLYEEAAKCPAADAMERLDAELAKSELED